MSFVADFINLFKQAHKPKKDKKKSKVSKHEFVEGGKRIYKSSKKAALKKKYTEPIDKKIMKAFLKETKHEVVDDNEEDYLQKLEDAYGSFKKEYMANNPEKVEEAKQEIATEKKEDAQKIASEAKENEEHVSKEVIQTIMLKSDKLLSILVDRFEFKKSTRIPKGLLEEFALTKTDDEENAVVEKYVGELTIINEKINIDKKYGSRKKDLDAESLRKKMMLKASKNKEFKKALLAQPVVRELEERKEDATTLKSSIRPKISKEELDKQTNEIKKFHVISKKKPVQRLLLSP
jgi:hypothetical protein